MSTLSKAVNQQHAQMHLGGVAVNHTPAEIVADVLEERGRLYWEQVGKIVDSAMDEWKRINPTNLSASDWMNVPGQDKGAIDKFIEKACQSLAVAAYKDSFEAFAVLRHSKHPNAFIVTSLEVSGKKGLQEKFTEDGPFPWTLLALNALYGDCYASLGDRFKVLPQG